MGDSQKKSLDLHQLAANWNVLYAMNRLAARRHSEEFANDPVTCKIQDDCRHANTKTIGMSYTVTTYQCQTCWLVFEK